MVGGKRFIIFFLALCFILSAASSTLAYDRVIANSHDWHDVYSAMLFASLEGVPSNFLVSQKHASILLYSIPTTEKNLLVVSSRKEPYFVGYQSFLRSRGYDNAEELVTRDANLDLARKLTNITKFIVVDPAYGYNALSAAPYAAISKSYVLFADRRSVDGVVAFLKERNPTSLLLFGQLDREVKSALAQFNPETLDKGDRFSNAIAMVDRYKQYGDIRQVILTNGEFIEASMMSGDDPVIFIGRANVPDVVRDYIKKNDIQVGILIGNELIGTATFVRRQLGISVFVKFAQGSRVPQGAISKVEDLDRFPMPRYQLNLEVTSIVYNRATQSLEVTYHNPQELALYFKGTITITGGDAAIVLGDENPLFLDKGAYKTIVYTQDSDGQPLFLAGDEDYVAELYTIFGEGPRSLENAIQAKIPISFITVKDETIVNITDLYYNKGKGAFIVTIENTGGVDAYVRPEIVDLIVNGEPVTVAADKTVLVPAGKSVKIPISIKLAEEDFAENPQVMVRAYYGAREQALIKVTKNSFALKFGGVDVGGIVLYAVIILVVLFLLFFLGTKKKCKHCGHKNPRGRKRCEKCGQKL